MAQLDIAQYDAETHGRAASVEAGGKVAEVDGVLQHVAKLSAEVDADVADVPLQHHLRRQTVGQLQSYVDLARLVDGVSQIGGVAGLIVIVAVGAEEGAEPLAFLVERSHAEGVAPAYERLVVGAVEQAVGMGGEAHILDRVVAPQTTHIHRVGHLGLLGVGAGNLLGADMTVEVTVLLQLVLGHRHAQGGVDLAHQLGLGSEGARNPPRQGRAALREGVPYPQLGLERRAVVAAAKEGAVGRRGKHRLHLYLGVFGMLARLVVGILDRLEPGEELFALGQRPGGGAASRHQCRHSQRHAGGHLISCLSHCLPD